MRVEHHFDALKDGIKGFLGGDPYAIICEPDPKLDQYVLWTEVREEPPPEWSPIIGDIIHNWRSALDHLAYQLVIRNERKPSGSTAFPIRSKSPFDASTHASAKEAENALKSWERQTKGMHTNDVALIKKLQPYSGEYGSSLHPLFALARLSNWDKHRGYHLTGQTLQGTTFTIREWQHCEWFTLYERTVGAFKNGTEMARYAFVPTGPKPKMDVKIKVFFDIAFGEGSPLEGLGVKKTLLAIGSYVSDIIIEFKDRLDRQDFVPPPFQ